MRVAPLPEASRLHSCNLVLCAATVKVNNSTVRDDCENQTVPRRQAVQYL